MLAKQRPYAPSSEEQRRVTEALRNEARLHQYAKKKVRDPRPLRVGETELCLTPHHIENFGARVLSRLCHRGRDLHLSMSAADTRLLADYLKIAACEADDIRNIALAGAYKGNPWSPIGIGSIQMQLTPHQLAGIGGRVRVKLSVSNQTFTIHPNTTETRLLADYLKIAACEAESLARKAAREIST